MALPNGHEYIVVEGNIGSGKTTLSKMLAERYNSRLMLEEFKDNPFLPKFYKDPKQHAFALELSFLAERYHQKRGELNKTDLFKPGIICDYSFAKSLVFARINLDADEFELYQNLFNIIHGRLPKPDLLLYLYCSPEKAKSQIAKRGRVYEQDIKMDYLEKINSGYLDFFRQQKEMTTIILDTNSLDFVKSRHDFESICSILSVQRKSGMSIVE